MLIVGDEKQSFVPGGRVSEVLVDLFEQLFPISDVLGGVLRVGWSSHEGKLQFSRDQVGEGVQCLGMHLFIEVVEIKIHHKMIEVSVQWVDGECFIPVHYRMN